MQDNQQAQPVGTDIATLPVADRAVRVLNSTKAEKELRELVAKSSGIVNVIDSAGREEAHRAGMTLKNARIAIEKTGKAARDDATKFSKAVIAEEQRLVAIVTPEETRVLALRDAFDAKVRAEKEEAERKEAARVQGIKAQIAGILNLPANSFRDSAVQLKETLDDLDALEITEALFAEFAGDAAEAKATALLGLRDLLAKAQAFEAEQARMEEERAELQRIQAAEVEKRRAAEAEAARVAAEKAETQRQLDAALAELEQRRKADEQPKMWSPEPAPVVPAQAVPQDELPVGFAFDDLADDVGGAIKINTIPYDCTHVVPPPASDAEPAVGICGINATTGRYDIDVELNGKIQCLLLVLSDLRALGMNNETILFTVGEALEAIDAKEAA